MQCLLRKTNIKVVLFTVRLFNLLFLSLCLMNPNVMGGWKTQTIIDPDDPKGIEGLWPSIAFDPSGKPAISYYEWPHSRLKYAHDTNGDGDFNDPGEIIIVDTAEAECVGNEGAGSSLAFDSSGKPGISYSWDCENSFKYAHDANGDDDFNDPGEITIVDSSLPEEVGYGNSLAFDASGKPGISYIDDENGNPKYAHDTNGDGDFNDPGEITIVDPSGNVEGDDNTSLAFDASGYPAIAYHDDKNGNLKYAHDTNGDGDFNDPGEITIVDSSENMVDDEVSLSLAFDASGYPAIAYQVEEHGTLKYAHYNSASWDITTVDSPGGEREKSRSLSLAFDASGKPCISYYAWINGSLKYACYNGTDWIIETVDSDGYVGLFSSLAFDASDDPAISYFDWTSNDLKLARFVPGVVCQCVDDSIPPTGCVSGRVTNLAGQPLENKTVTLRRVYPTPGVTKTAVTDNNGCYGAVDLADGSYRAQVKGCSGGGVKAVVVCGHKVSDVDFKCR